MQEAVLAVPTQRQHPHATILGCNDFRVPPELVADAGFGFCRASTPSTHLHVGLPVAAGGRRF